MIGSFNTKQALESANQRVAYLEKYAANEVVRASEYCELERQRMGHDGAVFYPSYMFGDSSAWDSIRELKSAIAFMEQVSSKTVSFTDKETSLIFGIPRT